MMLRVTSVRVANPTRQQFLETTLGRIPTPPGERWLARLCEDARTGAWELLVDGPAPSVECEGWEVSRTLDERLRFRTFLTGRTEQSADGVRRRVRQRAWSGVRFTHNSVARGNPQLTQAFEDAVWDLVLAQGLSSLEVRLNFWQPFAGEVHCYCEVEAAPRAGETVPCHIWCPLVRTPQELAAVLGAALRERCEEPEHPLLSLLAPVPSDAGRRLPLDDSAPALDDLLALAAYDGLGQETAHWV